MPGTKDVVIHQIRQMICYTFYFSMSQLLIINYDLSPIVTSLVFITLMGISVYEDSFFFDQNSLPESILVLRIWSNNIPLLASNLLIYILDKGNLLKMEEAEGPKLPGRPHHIYVKTPESGYNILDDIFLCMGYYLFYFSSIVTFRALVSQIKYVKRLVNENMNWVSDEPNTNNSTTGEETETRGR